ncbi:MAG: hypothetical protein DMD81_27535, partial [Candidatus Rokuibacteriota bacterium]
MAPRTHAAAPLRSRRGRSRALARGRSRQVSTDRSRRVRRDRRRRCRADLPAGDLVIRILDPGPLTTVQDLGRGGQLRFGIPPSGPMDRDAFVLANRLCGNADGQAGLECTVVGPRFTAGGPCAIAVTGAEAPVTVNGARARQWATIALAAGDLMRIGAATTGAR